MNNQKLNSRQQRGLAGESHGKKFLEQSKGFQILQQGKRIAHPGGYPIEIDFICWNPRSRVPELWLVEVKTHQCFQYSYKQRKRLYIARRVLTLCNPGIRIRVSLLLVTPSTGRIEFLENP